MSDINIGALSEAINDKMDRDAQNVDTTAGADVVVAFQVPTSSNNYTWYRKYKSGWVEQGGATTTSSNTNTWVTTVFNLAVTMANSDYLVYISNGALTSGAYGSGSYIDDKTVTTFTFYQYNINGANVPICWEVKGMAA